MSRRPQAREAWVLRVGYRKWVGLQPREIPPVVQTLERAFKFEDYATAMDASGRYGGVPELVHRLGRSRYEAARYHR